MLGYCYILKHKYDQHSIYVGSTIDKDERLSDHKDHIKNDTPESNQKKYQYMKKYGGVNCWEMIQTYYGPYYEIFEKNYIKSTWLYNLNKIIPLQTKQEIKDKRRHYKAMNKTKIKEYNERTREHKREIGRLYHQNNKDRLNKKAKDYRQVNKEKIEEKAKEKIPCPKCGSMISRRNIRAHQKKPKCMESTQNIYLKVSQLE